MNRRELLKKLLILPAIFVAPDLLGRVIPNKVLPTGKKLAINLANFGERGYLNYIPITREVVFNQGWLDRGFIGPPEPRMSYLELVNKVREEQDRNEAKYKL